MKPKDKVAFSQEIAYKQGDQWKLYYHGTRFAKICTILKSIIPIQTFQDIGCANGLYMRFIHKLRNNIAVYGVDISSTSLHEGKEKLKHGEFILADAGKLPFKDNCFDLTLCSEVLEHTSNPREIFYEILRTSRRYVLLSFPLRTFYIDVMKRIFPWVFKEHISWISLKDIMSWINSRASITKTEFMVYLIPLTVAEKLKSPASLTLPLSRINEKISRISLVKYGLIPSTTFLVLLRKNHSNRFD
jgi:ubiquinone/menaquinone biosynthesis C-methylase UbiE